jgi:hypothetical protein
MAWGAASWPMMWPLAVVLLAHLVAELADGQDLSDPRGGGGHEVEGLGQRADAADHRDAQVQLEVLAQRRLGVHGHGPDVGCHLARREVGRAGLEEGGQVTLGVHLAGEHALAVLGGQAGQGGGHGGLAHATLAGDEDQFELQQVRRVRHGHRGRTEVA